MIKVLHVTPGLENGGAEVMLTKLVGQMDKDRFQNVVVSLTDEGQVLGRKIREQAIPLHTLGFSRSWPNPILLLKLADLIRKEKPDVIQTWMYHANVVGSLANSMAGRCPVVWGLHKAKFDLRNFKPRTRQIILLNGRMAARFPTWIACGSEAVQTAHLEIGYPPNKLKVIANGIDTAEFAPNGKARLSLRNQLGLSETTPLVGLVARFTKEKDHPTFFRAAGILLRRRPDVRFVLCGSEITDDNPLLKSYIDQSDVSNATHLLGLTSDPAGVTAALDVATCTSSSGESFSLALGEAMACGVPCVTTDMQGPAAVVADLGIVAPIGNANALADAWEQMLNLSPEKRAVLGAKSRQRIVDYFSLTAMVRGFEHLYSELCP